MIQWSTPALKFTLGLGVLCTAGLLAELTHPQMPAWLAVALAILPIAAFVFVQPGDVSWRIARAVQVAASVWYIALASVVVTLFLEAGANVHGWPLYISGLLIGSVPCAIVLKREIQVLRALSKKNVPGEELTSRIPPLRRQQFSFLEAAEGQLFSWSKERGIPLHRVEFVVPFVETDFGLSVWLFYHTDEELVHEQENSYSEIDKAFMDILRALGYPEEWCRDITFTFDSHEHVERDYQGNYFYRLR
jgi:hypothetical protein